jgi:protein-S-isoprenylcysteine O-methyltransferase Ste14
MPPFDDSQSIGTATPVSTRKAVLLTAIAVGIVFLLFGASRWDDRGWVHETIEWAGIALIAICIVGRTWCSLYIGGRKNEILVTDGPYSISRNPLYFFSIVGAVGVGAQVGSIVIALTCGFIAWAVLLRAVLDEKQVLLAAFSDDYRRYVAAVPCFLPKLSLWRDRDTVEVRPNIVVTTFVDALVFLIAIPIAEGIEMLQDIGVLPIYITLP